MVLSCCDGPMKLAKDTFWPVWGAETDCPSCCEYWVWTAETACYEIPGASLRTCTSFWKLEIHTYAPAVSVWAYFCIACVFAASNMQIILAKRQLKLQLLWTSTPACKSQQAVAHMEIPLREYFYLKYKWLKWSLHPGLCILKIRIWNMDVAKARQKGRNTFPVSRSQCHPSRRCESATRAGPLTHRKMCPGSWLKSCWRRPIWHPQEATHSHGTSMWRGMECWEGTSAVEIFCFCWMLCIGLVWGTFAIFGPVGEDFESRPTLDCIGVLWRVFFKSKVVYSAQADVTCLRWWLVPA